MCEFIKAPLKPTGLIGTPIINNRAGPIIVLYKIG